MDESIINQYPIEKSDGKQDTVNELIVPETRYEKVLQTEPIQEKLFTSSNMQPLIAEEVERVPIQPAMRILPVTWKFLIDSFHFSCNPVK